MKLNEGQSDILADYFADASKILFASTVVAFFIPATATPMTLRDFFGGLVATVGFLVFSLTLKR